MRASTIHSTPLPATPTYSVSVPLSVYRELAAELQATKARLDFFNAQNTQLATENQQLRQEIEKAVQSVLHLKQSVDSTLEGSRSYADNSTKNFRAEPSRPASRLLPMPQSYRPPTAVQSAVESSFQTRTSSVSSEKLFIEQEEGRYRRRSRPDPSGISGRSLAIAILLIMVTAFGAGYLIVRPLLQSR